MILLDEEKSRCQRKLSTWETLDFKAELISDPDLTFHGDRDLFHEILTARNGISSVDDHDLKTTTCECNLGKKRRFSCDFRQTSPPSGCSALSLRCIRSLSASELVTRDAKNVLSDNPLVKWFYEPEVMVAEKNRAKCKLAPCNARIRRPSFGLRYHFHWRGPSRVQSSQSLMADAFDHWCVCFIADAISMQTLYSAPPVASPTTGACSIFVSSFW